MIYYIVQNINIILSNCRLKSEKDGRIKGEEAVRALGGRTAIAERSAVAAESDLRIEREWRVALQVWILFFFYNMVLLIKINFCYRKQ